MLPDEAREIDLFDVEQDVPRQDVLEVVCDDVVKDHVCR